MKDWMYDEFNQVGTDYSKDDVIYAYDADMEEFRDYDQEVKKFVEAIGLEKPDELTVIDIGCGTGAFSIHAAQYFKKIIAVDVSPMMLTVADSKAAEKGISNIEFITKPTRCSP